MSAKDIEAQRLNTLLDDHDSGTLYINEEHLEEIFAISDKETENLKSHINQELRPYLGSLRGKVKSILDLYDETIGPTYITHTEVRKWS